MKALTRAFGQWKIAAILSLLTGPVCAQEGTAPANQSDAPAPAPAEATPAEDAPKLGLTLGADLYYGSSNKDGAKRFRDGFWIGSAPTFPSNLYGIYNAPDGTSAKIALSVGKFYNGSVAGFDQPVEATVSKEFSGVSLTAGKFYVPFELLEWEYETEWGVQAARDFGKNGELVGAVTYNRRREEPNFYARYAKSFGLATVGISLGGGRGFSFDTDHNRGLALDATLEKGKFRFESAALAARKSNSDSQFEFSFARLNYQISEPLKIYAARHSWFDRLDQQGNGHYSTLGAAYQISKNFGLEGALSRSGDEAKTIRWIELHYTVEK